MDHRPGAADVQSGTEALSPGSVHPLVRHSGSLLQSENLPEIHLKSGGSADVLQAGLRESLRPVLIIQMQPKTHKHPAIPGYIPAAAYPRGKIRKWGFNKVIWRKARKRLREILEPLKESGRFRSENGNHFISKSYRLSFGSTLVMPPPVASVAGSNAIAILGLGRLLFGIGWLEKQESDRQIHSAFSTVTPSLNRHFMYQVTPDSAKRRESSNKTVDAQLRNQDRF